MRYSAVAIFCAGLLGCVKSIEAEDWPMWRHDPGRTGVAVADLPKSLKLKWVRQLPKVTPAYQSPRLQFDAGYEPIVADGRLLIASSRTDSVTAYEAATGREIWVFRTNGPVRFAPAVSDDSVCFGSDDGHLYCVDLKTGELRWKHRAVPSDRRLLGNQRLISVWPVRGGPVIADGRVYFAAGVWPFEGVFVYSVDVSSGELIWRNERLGYLFGQQPHNTQAIGGLAPQGYLVVNEDELIVPCSTAYPARLNRDTGKLIEFALPSPGRFPGGWFAAMDPESARAIRRGKLTFDDVVNRQLHEDKVNIGDGVSGISRTILVDGESIIFDDPMANVEGTIHAVIAANEQMFVSTREGSLYCFGATDNTGEAEAKQWNQPIAELTTTAPSIELAHQLTAQATASHGYALVVGVSDGSLLKALLKESQYHVIAIDDDPDRVERLRVELDLAGLYGNRCAIIEGHPGVAGLPPYFATLITTETPQRMSESWHAVLPALRPYGGIAATRLQSGNSVVTEESLRSIAPSNFELSEIDGQLFVRRFGSLPGAADYSGSYALCEDELVRFPLGVLWFDDTLAHFKRSPQPRFTQGVMISRPKDWHAPRIKGNYDIDYPLMSPVLSDIYTGRVFENTEQQKLRSELPVIDGLKPQQSYYHAPHQKTKLHPEPPLAGERTNPLTRKSEPRVFPKTYGCDGGVDYGAIYTLRSGTAAFYDKSLESGTVFLSGPRSGCTNSIIPSGGVLNVPYFYEGCTCSYPLPIAMSLVAMPETHEQWSSWGEQKIEPGSLQRIGLNFGAPGDRMTREGTLWLDFPSVGGPSPNLYIETVPQNTTVRYRHSIWMNGGEGWPWVAASTIEGLSRLTLQDLKPGRYTVRLFFAEIDNLDAGERVQTITIQGRPVLNGFDISAETTASMKGTVRESKGVEIDDKLTLEFSALKGRTLISGVEIIREP